MKLATDPPVSEAQRKAMWAAASGHSTLGIPKKVGEEYVGKDEDLKAAGVMYLTKDGQVLLLKRSKDGDHQGEWGIAGGKVEDEDENIWSTAYREAKEELGEVPPGQGGMKAAKRVKDGVDFTTFFNLVDKPFIPTLDSEHTGFTWASLNDLPDNVHPGVMDVVDDLQVEGLKACGTKAEDMEPEDWSGLVGGLLKFISEEAEEPEHAEDVDICALDESSVREYDTDGRLHVAKTHISKANVCPYYGREIPDGATLGLQPERIYNLYRHPDELKKAADTFNNLPLLSKHVAVSADQHPSDLVIGSTGTDAVFNFPYLDNSLVIWTRGGIAAIEEEIQKELSCAYRYRADMVPGTIEGQSYDGVMRDIIGNHVALVKNGRAGSDVVVGDNALPQLKELLMPSATVLSRKAALAKGALIVHLRPKMAADAQIDLTPILKDVTQANFKDKKSGILDGLNTALKGKLAKDANLNDVTGLLDALEECDEPEGMDADPETEIDKEKKGKDKKAKDADKDEDEEDKKKMKKAEDAEEDEEKDKKKKAEDKKAMDGAIDAAVKKVKADNKAMRDAERVVRPYVGELAIACDSADDVFRIALETLGVEVKDVHPSAFPAILKAQPVPGARNNKTEYAMDSAGIKSFNDRYPDAGRIKSL